MKLKNTAKAVALAATVGLGLTVVAPAAGAAAPTPSQKLVDALKALKVDQVDYLYSYLQSVNLTDSEYNQIMANANQLKSVLGNTTDVTKLTSAQKAEASRLFLASAQLAHLQVEFVDDKGNKIDLANFDPNVGLHIQLEDLNGNVLAAINPTKEDLNPETLTSMIASLKNAVQAKLELEKGANGGKFVPMPSGSGELPNTASQDPVYIALGALLLTLGGVALVPAARAFRKEDGPVEA